MRLQKDMKKFLSLALAGLVCFGSLTATACQKDDPTDSGSTPPVAQNPVTDKVDRGEITNALHKVNVTPSNRVLVSNAGTLQATTEYVVVVDSHDSYALRAASYIAGQLTNASGAQFVVDSRDSLDGLTVTKDSKYIIVGFKELFFACGLEMPEENLGPAGYYIRSYGDSVFLEVQMYDGYQLGALAFLREVVGYDMIAHDTIVYDGKGETLPDMEIIERPDFDYRNYTNWMTQNGLYGMGYNYKSIFTYIYQEESPENKAGVHNIFYYLPESKYLNADDRENYHPEWYSSNSKHRQLCYTAHGDPVAYEAMQNTMLDVMLRCVLAQPEQGVVTVTQADAPVCCDCDACNSVLEQDGSISATIIRYMNDLDEKFQAALTKYAQDTNTERRTVQLAFFAYHTSYNPPTTSVEEDPTLKCSPNITVFIAPINAKYVESFYHEDNRVYADMVRAWSEYTDNIMAWVYETNYHHYMFPYNTYSSMVDTYYFFKQQGANIIYNEGQRWSENVTCFGKLKEYLDAKAQFDVTISYEEYKDKFFKNYYGPAAEIMEEYYNQLRQWTLYVENAYGLGGGIYEEIADNARPQMWPRELLEGWLALMDKAYAAVAHLEIDDPLEYKRLVKHIKIETLFPRYALCTLHVASYTPSQLRQLRIAFMNDGNELGLAQHKEHDYITTVYSQWGIA